MSELSDAIKFAETVAPLPRCKHGQALRDHSGEALEPPCGCQATATEAATQVEKCVKCGHNNVSDGEKGTSIFGMCIEAVANNEFTGWPKPRRACGCICNFPESARTDLAAPRVGEGEAGGAPERIWIGWPHNDADDHWYFLKPDIGNATAYIRKSDYDALVAERSELKDSLDALRICEQCDVEIADDNFNVCGTCWNKTVGELVAERDAVVNAVLSKIGKRWRSMPVEQTDNLEIQGSTAAIVADDATGAAVAVVELALGRIISERNTLLSTVEELREVVRAIEAHHFPLKGEAKPDTNKYCNVCVTLHTGRSKVWPCKTVKLVRTALAGVKGK